MTASPHPPNTYGPVARTEEQQRFWQQLADDLQILFGQPVTHYRANVKAASASVEKCVVGPAALGGMDPVYTNNIFQHGVAAMQAVAGYITAYFGQPAPDVVLVGLTPVFPPGWDRAWAADGEAGAPPLPSGLS
ncbi:hypothetical protein LTR65_007465 [Meristemomyces frigidus]